MKKIVVFNSLQTGLSGGIGRYSFELSKEMSALNDKDIDLKIVIREEDINIFNFIPKENLIIIKGIKNGIQRNYYEQFKLPKIIKMKYPEAIVHYPDTMAPLFSKNKSVITIHDMAFMTLNDEFSFKTKIWKKIITKKSVRKANNIIAITKFTKKEIVKYYPEKSNKIKIIYNGFNKFNKSEINLDNVRDDIKNIDTRYILSVNTITPRKNIQGILNAFQLIKEKSNCNLIIAGKEGYKSEEITNLIKEYSLESRVMITGKVNDDELKYLYKNASIYIYISFYEGFGLSPLEAISFGVPTITSNVTSIPEVVKNLAIKLDPNDITSISNEMYKILENKNYEEQIKEHLIKSKIEFSWQKCAAETLEVYKNM